MQWVADEKLRPQVHKVMPLENADAAMQMVADRKARARVVLEVRTETLA